MVNIIIKLQGILCFQSSQQISQEQRPFNIQIPTNHDSHHDNNHLQAQDKALLSMCL